MAGQPAVATSPRQASARSSSSRPRRGRRRPARRPSGVATEHLGELDDPALAVEPLDLGDGPAVALALGDPEVGVGVGGDLGQVGDAQDLVAAGERPQAPPDRVRAPAADARVDLVEDERRRLVGLGQDLLDGQRDARQLAARGDPGQRPRRLARVRGEAVDDLVDARRRRTRPRRRRARPPARRGPAGPPAERDLEDAGGEARARRARRRPRPSARRAAVPAGRRQALGGRLRPRRAGAASSALAPGPLAVEAAQPLGLGRGALAVGDDRGLVVAVAALERRRSSPSRSSSAASAAGSWSTVSASDRGPRRRRRSSSASRPASRSASGSKRGSRRATARASRSAIADAVARAAALGGQRLVDRRRSRGRSPRRAGRPRAGPGSRRPRRVAAARRRSRPPRARGARAAGRARADRSISSASAARFARQRSTASAMAARCSRVPAERVEQVALPALVEQPLLVVLAVDLDERPDLLGEAGGRHGLVVERGRSSGRRRPPRGPRSAAPGGGRRAPRRARSRRRGGRATCPRGPRAPARARRSAGSCRRRSRR